MAEWIDVASIKEIEEGEPLAATAQGTPLALFKVEGAFFALYDLCSHGAAKLSEGFVEGNCVECPLHQGLVEIATGEPMSAPITEAVRVFATRVVDGRLEVEI